MKKSFLFTICLSLGLSVLAQEPDWFESKNRMAFYPTNVFFSGFVMDELRKGADVEAGLEHVKAAARAEAVSTIQVYVNSVKQDKTRSESYQTMSKYVEEVYQQFSSSTTLATKMDIPGLKIDSYKKGNIVAAFAYVKRSDLKRQLEKQITMGLTRIETQLDNIEELMNNGLKMEARSRIEPIVKDFLPVEKNQELLLAVDANADAESLQLNEAKVLQQRYMKMKAALKNGVYVALHCNSDLFNGSYDAMAEQIKGNLSSLGCTFTQKDAEADWIVTINSAAREFSQVRYSSATTYFAYVDSNISIKKAKTGQVVYANNLSCKGGDTGDYIHAGITAYKDMTHKLSAIIQQQIKQ
ncbi:MAG: hypothetical protein IJQ95_04785 [Paludibacteraceae bacterium]|nr:hypothetical protein [Paludibacteraceae bacterium]